MSGREIFIIALQNPNRFIPHFLTFPKALISTTVRFSSSSHHLQNPISSATMKMKRRRKSKPMHIQRDSTEEDGARASITDLPIQILMDIQSRLSVKSIFRCRSVCKLWLNVLLAPDFAKLHFSRAPTCPLLHNPNGKLISTALYLVEIEKDRLCYVCDDENRRSTKLCSNSCDCHGSDGHVNMKLSTRFMLPNVEPSPELVDLKDHKLELVNSCNGLVCFRGSIINGPAVVYNPVTGEYLVLPSPEDTGDVDILVGGLGFCLKTNQYKVLIFVRKWNPKYSMVAFVYTLGSGPWRRVGYVPNILCGASKPTFLNSSLHWFLRYYKNNNLIFYFDFDDEKFQVMPPPRRFCRYLDPNKLEIFLKCINEHCTEFPPPVSMGVLRGCLFICDASSSFDGVRIWVMKDYGVQESWVEEFNIDRFAYSDHDKFLPSGKNQPVDFLNNGNLLLYRAKNALISYDGDDFRYFKIRGFQSKFEFIPHIRNFVSLKEVVGDDLEVLNVKSRELREGNTKPLPLIEEDRSLSIASDSD